MSPHELTFAHLPRERVTVLYGRLSRGDQSLEAQNAKMQWYAQDPSRAFQVVAELLEDDTTGDTEKLSIAERQKGRQLLAYLDGGHVGHLVVSKLDRICRRARGFLEFYDYLRARNVTLHITDFGGDTLALQGFVGKMFMTMAALFAEWELESIRSRTKDRLNHKRGQGELVGQVSFGQRVTYRFADGHAHVSNRALFWGGKKSTTKNGKRIELESQPPDVEAFDLIRDHGLPLEGGKQISDHPGEIAVLQMIERLRGQRVSYKRIAVALNEGGYTTKLGHPWQQGNVASVLNNATSREILKRAAAAAA